MTSGGIALVKLANRVRLVHRRASDAFALMLPEVTIGDLLFLFSVIFAAATSSKIHIEVGHGDGRGVENRSKIGRGRAEPVDSHSRTRP